MHAVAASVGVAIDRIAGEPPVSLHPVAAFGRLMGVVERNLYNDRVTHGAIYTSFGLVVAVAPTLAVRRIVGSFAAAAAACAVASAGRMLEEEAISIRRQLDHGDLDRARTQLGHLVGRTTDGLDESAVSRACVESVAENTVDAVTATIFWTAIAGAPGASGHRGVNTMDAMVGHRSPRYARFGRVAAKLDDLANWLPARLTALAVIVAAPSQARSIITTVKRDARRHPSPNGGVVEAAFAAALGIRLGGVNVYGDVVEDRGELGDGRRPMPSDIAAATSLARRVTAVFVVGCLLAATSARGTTRVSSPKAGST